jgi:hypothetical protein
MKIAKYFSYLLSVLVYANAAHGWEYHSNQDVMDDSDRSYVVADFDRDVISSSGDPFAIAFKCEADGLNFLISHSYLIGNSDDDIRVEMRFDNSPAKTYWWPLQSSNKLTYAEMSAVPTILSSAKVGTKVAVRIIDPGDGEAMTSIFSLVGISDALTKLSCA